MHYNTPISFIPSAVKLWNEACPRDRFISAVNKSLKVQPNELFYLGTRNNYIKHAQLRMKCSKLNAHLFSLHVIDSPACICGHNIEDCEHFLLHCPLYYNLRQTLFQTLSNLIDNQHLNTDTLLFGNENYDNKTNCEIFVAVQQYLLDSNRL